MKNNVFLSLSLVFLFLVSCKKETESKIIDNPEVETLTETPKKADRNSVTYRLLQGKWQCVDDKKSFVVYDATSQYSLYEGYENTTGFKYEISDSCLLDIENKGTSEKDKYITIPEVSQCLYIIKVSTDSLLVSNVGRGNTLRYIRVN